MKYFKANFTTILCDILLIFRSMNLLVLIVITFLGKTFPTGLASELFDIQMHLHMETEIPFLVENFSAFTKGADENLLK